MFYIIIGPHGGTEIFSESVHILLYVPCINKYFIIIIIIIIIINFLRIKLVLYYIVIQFYKIS